MSTRSMQTGLYELCDCALCKFTIMIMIMLKCDEFSATLSENENKHVVANAMNDVL